MVNFPDSFGIVSDNNVQAPIMAMKISFITVGIWWFVFSLYTFYYLPSRNTTSKFNSKIVFNGFKELYKVWEIVKSHSYLKSYLIAFFMYSIALQTVILVAIYFGEQEINWGDPDKKTLGLISSILIIQLVAVLGSFLTSRASSRFGNISTLIFINCVWVVLCVAAYFVTQPLEFYITAGFVGLVMGGIQALSRSTYSKFLPDTKDTTSYFSFYDVAEKIGIVLGMLVYGFVDQITGSMRLSLIHI